MPRGRKGEPVEVPESVVRVLAEVLDHARRGETVRVIADDEEITTQQAADLLNVSRPYLVGIVDRGEIPSRKVGTRRRLKLADVLLYREIEQARRLDAVEIASRGRTRARALLTRGASGGVVGRQRAVPGSAPRPLDPTRHRRALPGPLDRTDPGRVLREPARGPS